MNWAKIEQNLQILTLTCTNHLLLLLWSSWSSFVHQCLYGVADTLEMRNSTNYRCPRTYLRCQWSH